MVGDEVSAAQRHAPGAKNKSLEPAAREFHRKLNRFPKNSNTQHSQNSTPPLHSLCVFPY